LPGVVGAGFGTGRGMDMLPEPPGAPGLVGPGFGLPGPGTPRPVPLVPDVPLDPEPDAPLDDPPAVPLPPPVCAKLRAGPRTRIPAVNSVRVVLTISTLLRRNRLLRFHRSKRCAAPAFACADRYESARRVDSPQPAGEAYSTRRQRALTSCISSSDWQRASRRPGR